VAVEGFLIIVAAMNISLRFLAALAALAAAMVVAGCATRPVNPPLSHLEPDKVYTIGSAEQTSQGRENLVILAFSGGGTRAAAFSYGVLETLRGTEVVTSTGRKVRLLDAVDVITGVSGGSFTALAYGLYGEKLFSEYEQRFLKRNVQGELIARFFNPTNWGALWSRGWGRSELAADLYDEILFNNATFADLWRGSGPTIAVSATDLSSGSRLVFIPANFDVMCADLGAIRLSRAAAASSAVPVVLSPVTINNYGGTCGWKVPPWAKRFLDSSNPPRPAQRTIVRLRELQALANGAKDPYLHLVDGGVSDNLGLRGVVDVVETYEALHDAGLPTPLDHVRRIIVFIVNSLSTPETDWNKVESNPGTVEIMVKAAGVPIDRYSGESVELLKDIAFRWKALREIRESVTFVKEPDPSIKLLLNAPDIDIYPIDVSFPRLADKAERDYLNELPTSFVLPPEAVDRLRAAAAKIIVSSPEFQRLLTDAGARVVEETLPGAAPPAK
jgi:NTE family protein